jgi:kynureninase
MTLVEPAATDPDRAQALDAADPLRGYRDRFAISDQDLVYLDGNSLGRLPLATADRLRHVAEREWAGDLIGAWDHWLDLPLQVGDRIARSVVGAMPGEVVVSDSTTVNFYKLAHAALEARPERRVIITDRANFPTDRYVLEGLAARRGLEIRWLEPDPIHGPQPAEVADVLDREVALVTLSHVNYRSAAVADLPAITALAHDVGALTLWDLSHAAGSVPVDLEASGADLAVGCTYKYLNAGPGAPAWLYVRAPLQGELRNPVQGWFGQHDQFAMGQGYDPSPGIRSWLTGTPTILAVAAVDEGVAMIEDAGMEAIRAKGIALSAYAVELHDAWLAPLGFELGSPRDAGRRGAHVAVRHPDAREYNDALIASGVVTDFREPDSIRLGLSPLSTRFGDVRTGMDRLRALGSGRTGEPGRG